MSKNQVEWVSFESTLKNHSIIITATGMDEETAEVVIPSEDIKAFYSLNPAAFFEKFGEDVKELESLFVAVNGIGITHE